MSQSGVVSWSQTAASNATADSNVNWAEGMAPSQVNDSARAMMASVAKFRDDGNGSEATAGTATAYTYTSQQGFASLTALNGQTFALIFHLTSGASPTLNIDGLGPFPLVTDGGGTFAPPQGSIRAFSIQRVTYFNNNQIFVIHGGHSLIEPGRIVPHGMTTAPPGWLPCDGSAVSRTTYADLFANISTAFGIGNGTTTFNVPNLQDKVPAGKGSGSILTFSGTLGSTGGEATHVLTVGELPAAPPTGTIGGSQNLGTVVTTAGGQNVGSASPPAINTPGSNLTVNGSNFTFTGNNLGSGTGHNNVQPTLIVNYFIKT